MKPGILAVLAFKPDGTGHGLYTEVIDLRRLGRLRIARATRIEFDNQHQTWVVLKRGGKQLFASASRTKCLDWEREKLMNVV